MILLNVKELKKSYQSPEGIRTPILDIHSFSLERKELVFLEGQSGTGKTTFLNLIAGILVPDEGSVELDGEALEGMSESKRDRVRAKKVGYIFQSFHLLQGLSALENVLISMSFSGKVDRARAIDLLEQVGLKERLHYQPGQLSVGQQQRVAVARALANHPQLVLADEPTGSLDRQHASAALKLIIDICRRNEASLLLVSHDSAVSSLFDRSCSLLELNSAIEEKEAQ